MWVSFISQRSDMDLLNRGSETVANSFVLCVVPIAFQLLEEGISIPQSN